MPAEFPINSAPCKHHYNEHECLRRMSVYTEIKRGFGIQSLVDSAMEHCSIYLPNASIYNFKSRVDLEMSNQLIKSTFQIVDRTMCHTKALLTCMHTHSDLERQSPTTFHM